MNILWVSHFLLFPEAGFGALQRSRNLLIELAQRHRVFLLSYYRNTDLTNLSDLEIARRDLERYCSQVELLYLPFDRTHKLRTGITAFFSGLPHSVALYRTKELMRRAVELVDTHQIDILHVDTLGLVDEVLGQLPVPVKTLTHHNVESQMMLRRAEKEPSLLKRSAFFLEAVKLRKYEQRACPSYDLNLMVSDLDESILRGHVPELQSTVIPNGVDCEYFSFSDRETATPSIIFTGGLDWYPNADAIRYFCTEVWPELKRRVPDITFDIIGRNASRDLKSFVTGLPGIRMHGYVPDVRPYIKQSKIFICPIRDGGGTRLKILDALAQGIPVIGTDIACEGLGVKHGEHVLYANTPKEFLTMIERLLSNDVLCQHLSVTGRRFIEQHYSFKAIGGMLSDTYERMFVKKKG